MMMRSLLILSVAVALVAPPVAASAASFVPLGFLPGPDPPGSRISFAEGISANGTTVVGWSSSASGQEAFRWNATEGLVGLGDLPGGFEGSFANGVSADGSVVVGEANSANGAEAFRWSAVDGMTGLGDLAGGIFRSKANAISADGSTIVGFGTSASGVEAFRWTFNDGLIGLGDLPGGAFDSRATGASADGAVIAGWGFFTSTPPFEADGWTWDGTNGILGIGSPPGTGSSWGSLVQGISADGSRLTGQSYGSIRAEAFILDAATGFTELGELTPLGESFARAISADGSTVVGQAENANDELEAFIWNATDGMQALQALLVAQGVTTLGSWTLERATGVSEDGGIVVGYGTNPSGESEAFLAVLNSNAPPTPALTNFVVNNSTQVSDQPKYRNLSQPSEAFAVESVSPPGVASLPAGPGTCQIDVLPEFICQDNDAFQGCLDVSLEYSPPLPPDGFYCCGWEAECDLTCASNTCAPGVTCPTACPFGAPTAATDYCIDGNLDCRNDQAGCDAEKARLQHQANVPNCCFQALGVEVFAWGNGVIQSQVDSDGDAYPDACDNCADDANTTQTDADGDQRGDACDTENASRFVCGDTDLDGCDDCSYGFFDPDNDGINPDGSPICVPEPGLGALLSSGLAGLGLAARRRRRA